MSGCYKVDLLVKLQTFAVEVDYEQHYDCRTVWFMSGKIAASSEALFNQLDRDPLEISVFRVPFPVFQPGSTKRVEWAANLILCSAQPQDIRAHTHCADHVCTTWTMRKRTAKSTSSPKTIWQFQDWMQLLKQMGC